LQKDSHELIRVWLFPPVYDDAFRTRDSGPALSKLLCAVRENISNGEGLASLPWQRRQCRCAAGG
jgi:hypothetical protein